MPPNKFFSYLITDPSWYGENAFLLKVRLFRAIQKHNPDIILFRDKRALDTKKYALRAKRVAKRYKKRVYINSFVDLSKRFCFDGVHLPSSKMELAQKVRRMKKELVISTHTFEEIKRANRFKATFITYSPIFPSPNKAKAKGIKNLKKALRFSKVPIVALGGIVSKKQLQAIKKSRAAGFASIRYFV